MKTSRHNVSCDLCRTSVLIAQSDGWSVHPAGGGDYCPTCSPMAAGRN